VNIHKIHVKKYFSLPILGIMLSMAICWCCFAVAAENESAILPSAKVLSEEKDWLETREKLGNLRHIYKDNEMFILNMFRKAMDNHHQNRGFYSPLHASIEAVGVWRIRPAIGNLLSIIDYCLDAKTIPDGLMMLGQSFYPAVESLILLEVEPERLVQFIAKEKEPRRASLAAYVLCNQLKRKEKAIEYLNRELVHYTNDRQRDNIQKAIDLIKKVEYDCDLIPSPYTP
jgi:hypothetical protein